MKIALVGLFLAATLGTNAAFAADCGEAPHKLPFVPSGETAGEEGIRQARNAVVKFSTEVDDYLSCMDTRATKILPYLTKEQKARWEEDLADLHDKRRDIQNEMNLAIRAYRKTNSN